MAGNNESEINEMTNIENCNESNRMSDFEIHSTPNVSRENKIKNNSDETNITEDSGVQVTPTSTKCSKSDNDMSFLQQQFREQNNKFNELKKRFDNKFDNVVSVSDDIEIVSERVMGCKIC